jgi:5-formaminoimidazole-4-carboxamide-1-beta-D-ribofuranosyl 5'-monophosphate synthetase
VAVGDHDLNPDDPYPAMMAEIDQAIAVAPQMARAVKGYYAALTDEGFNEKQAAYFTAAYFTENDLEAP